MKRLLVLPLAVLLVSAGALVAGAGTGGAQAAQMSATCSAGNTGGTLLEPGALAIGTLLPGPVADSFVNGRGLIAGGGFGFVRLNVNSGTRYTVSVDADFPVSIAVWSICPTESLWSSNTGAVAFRPTGGEDVVSLLVMGHDSGDIGDVRIRFTFPNIQASTTEDAIADGRAQSEAVQGKVDRVLERTGNYQEWFFAEGTTRPGFQEYLTLLSETTQDITIRYFTEAGPQAPIVMTLAAGTRATRDVNADVGAGHDVSVRITGTAPFYAERPIYFSGVTIGELSGTVSGHNGSGEHD